MRKIGLILMAVALSGCTTYRWQNPNKPDSEFNVDKYACERDAAQMYPVMLRTQMVSQGYTGPAQTNCYQSGMYTNCQTTPGVYIPPKTTTVDENKAARNSAITSCLRANGWSRVAVER